MRALRYSFYNLTLIFTFLSFLAGKGAMWYGFIFLLLIAVIGDRILPEDRKESGVAQPLLLNILLFSILPSLTLNVMAFTWQMADHDWLGLGASMQNTFGINALQRRADQNGFDLLGAIATLALLCASSGTNVAHELVHRTWDDKALWTGRWLLSFTFDTSFSIEHVYGHHANIATRRDPASARRGELYYAFVFRSTWGSLVGAWNIESERLRKRNFPIWSHHNRFLRGQLMTLTVLAFYYAVAGMNGLIFGSLAGIAGKAYLEAVNYIEHYGLVRIPGSPVEPKHSWNSNHRISSLFLYNLTRHSHHHAKGHLPFWKLEAMPDAPCLPYGYMSMIILATCPPIYMRIMDPLVAAWDLKYASEAEKLQRSA